jgi:hypothetical protein
LKKQRDKHIKNKNANIKIVESPAAMGIDPFYTVRQPAVGE